MLPQRLLVSTSDPLPSDEVSMAPADDGCYTSRLGEEREASTDVASPETKEAGTSALGVYAGNVVEGDKTTKEQPGEKV